MPGSSGLAEGGPGRLSPAHRQVLSRNPRRASTAPERIVIPGCDGLRALSQAHEPLLKAECGAPWQSYFLRSHWRMVFPIGRRHQERIALQLQQRVSQGSLPMVHIFRFPRITINHGLLLYGMVESSGTSSLKPMIRISQRTRPSSFMTGREALLIPARQLLARGELSVTEIFCGGLY